MALFFTEPREAVGGENSFAINNRFSKLYTILPANPFRFLGVDIHFYTWNNLWNTENLAFGQGQCSIIHHLTFPHIVISLALKCLFPSLCHGGKGWNGREWPLPRDDLTHRCTTFWHSQSFQNGCKSTAERDSGPSGVTTPSWCQLYR